MENAMNRHLKQISVISLLLVGTYVAADPRSPQHLPAEPTLGELERRIQLLEDRIRTLERQNRTQLQQSIPQPIPTQEPALIPPGKPSAPAPPANDYWHKDVINGHPFYVIPVGHTDLAQ